MSVTMSDFPCREHEHAGMHSWPVPGSLRADAVGGLVGVLKDVRFRSPPAVPRIPVDREDVDKLLAKFPDAIAEVAQRKSVAKEQGD